MQETTIERVFTRNDWNEAFCDACTERKDVVLLGSERVCRDCLTNFFDESGDPIDFQQVRVAGVATVLAMIPLGVVIGNVIYEIGRSF